MRDKVTPFEFTPTPFRAYPRLSATLGVNLWVKHDDLFPITGGGNKSRKLCYILSDGLSRGCNALVTTGSAQSNHVRASVLLAARLGWEAIVFTHDAPPKQCTGNLLLSQFVGASVRFCSKYDLPKLMDDAMRELEERGLKPLYIWGGGHSAIGSYAYFEAAFEMASQAAALKIDPEYVVVPSGTGTTHAGLHLGLAHACTRARLIGVSVARDQARGLAGVRKAAQELADFIPIPRASDTIAFTDEFTCGGYAATTSELTHLIQWAAKTEGLILDPVYSGKAFLGLSKMITRHEIPRGSTVIFWHTGSLLNLLDAIGSARETAGN